MYRAWVRICSTSPVAFGYVEPCNVSTSTMKVVSKCPTTEIDLRNAVRRKNCDAIPNTCLTFDYHCLRNWNSTALVEVCAPSIYFIGCVCGEYNVEAMSVRGTLHLCHNFTPSCPERYKSTDQFKYPGCYIFESTSPTILISTGTSPTQISKETGEKKLDTESYSIGAIVGIVFAVEMGVIFIVYGIRIIYIKRKKEREGKNVTWKTVISTSSSCSWFKVVDSETTERIPEEDCLIQPETEPIYGQSGETYGQTGLATLNGERDIQHLTKKRKDETQQATFHMKGYAENGTQKITSNVQNTTQQTVFCEKSDHHRPISIGKMDNHPTTVKTQNLLPRSTSNGENDEQKGTFNRQNSKQQITSYDTCGLEHVQPGAYHITSNINGDTILTNSNNQKPSLQNAAEVDPVRGRVKLPCDESVSKCLRVMKKSQQLLHYNNTKTNKEMKYFNFVGAEGDNAVTVKCYITSKFNTIEPGLSFRFQNLTPRGKSEYWATSKTMISYTSTVDVNPDIVLPYLPENLPPDGLSQSLQEALNSSEKSIIMGKIVKVSPIKYVRDGNLAVKSLLLKDNSTVAKVCLFDKLAEGEYEEGSNLQITAVYAKKYLNFEQLTSTAQTKCQFLSDQNFPNKTEEDFQRFQSDGDFLDSTSELMPSIVTLTNILDMDIYDVCSNDACREKKMIKEKCPVCGGHKKKAEKNIRVTFLFSTESKKDQKATIFKDTLQEIVKDKIPIESKAACSSVLLEKLPVVFKSQITARNTFSNICHC
ncbi:uncharacterized protein LOC111105609 isoform X2 [Crassostrea virginica]